MHWGQFFCRIKCSGNRLLVSLCLVIPVIVLATEGFGISDDTIERVYREHGRRARNILLDWRELVDKNRHATDKAKLSAVNRFFNRRIRFVSDKRHWGRNDYWATPVETMVSRGGDCEDYSIAKYFTLRALGVPDERMRITYVRAKRLRQAHMVLTYYPSPQAEPLVLDNLTRKIQPASKRRDLIPVYSFNASNLWMAKERGRGRLVGSSSNVNLWRDVMNRIRRKALP